MGRVAEKIMRVLHLISSLAMGGAERFLLEFLTAVKLRSDVRCRLAVLNDRVRFYDMYQVTTGMECLGFHSSWRSAPAVWQAVKTLREYIRKEQVEILHTHLWIPDWIGALACMGSATCHISHIHNTLGWYTDPRHGFVLRRLAFSAALRLARTHFIGCSAAASDYTRKHLRLPPDRFCVIPYGIDVHPYARLPAAFSTDGPGIVGMAGRFEASKGHVVALTAFSQVVKLHPQALMRIAGDGPTRSSMETEIARLGLGDKVALLGRVKDMAGFYDSIDVLIQPSLNSEGLPLTILEAMCSGRIVVASDVAGAREVIEHAWTGYLVTPGDVEGLAKVLDMILKGDPGNRAQICSRARRLIARCCSREEIAERILAVYKHLKPQKNIIETN